jgi:hypothetical protein
VKDFWIDAILSIAGRLLLSQQSKAGGMNALLLIVSVVLPLLPVVMFPTRFFGRGMMSTVLGAGLLVGMMMLLYFGLQSMGGDAAAGPGDVAGLSSGSDADMSALAQLLK